uniref:Adenylate kinase isoenzyme 6 homolog n=1 Tax=Romanomermis culicivorax TaxID=13658 RepID=A0A915KZ92_ROMCU
MRRTIPNILIVGTPGTGKTTLASLIAEKAAFNHINISELSREKNFCDEFDHQRNCHVLDEDKLLDFLEDDLQVNAGGFVIEYHGCDFFPERWFDAVFILRTDNTKLFDRLKARNYSESKIRENVECEIFGVLCDEARDSYKSNVVQPELASNTTDDMEKNAETILQWIEMYKLNANSNGTTNELMS